MSRPTRSRVSSPFVAAGKNGAPETRNTKSEKSEGVARHQTTLDKLWAEPPSVIRPSFADSGLERHSAVLNMQALGTLPPAKLLKQVAVLQSGFEAGRDSTAKSGLSNASTPAESFDTPEPTPQTEAAPEEASEDVTEAPETPKAQVSDDQSFSRSEAAPQSAGEGVFSVQQSPVPTTTMTGQVPSRLQSASPIVPPIAGPDGKISFNLEWTDKVVEAAVQEAVDHRRWPTAYGLRTLYDENRSEPDFIRLTEAVYYRYATNAQFEEFEAMLAPKKREGRKDRTGEYYFNGDGSDPAPARSIVSFVQALNGPQREYRSVYSEPPQRSSSVATDTAPGGSSINQSSNAPTPNKETEASHVIPKIENNKSRASSTQANGEVKTNGSASKTPVDKQPYKDTPRSNSLSSSSSLSSVDEKLIANTGISPARPTSSHALASFGRFGVFDSNGVERPFVSPYASANNFQAAASSAETLARRNAQPIKKAPKPGPKIHTFSVTTTSVPAPPPAAASSSSSTNTFSPINAPADKSTRNNTTNKSAPSSMAPVALLATASNNSSASTGKYSSAFASKNGNKINAPVSDDVEKRMSLKRAAREKTNLIRGDRSFERHKVHVDEDNETASEGEESVAVAPPPAKRQKIRILNNSRTTRRHVNDDSDELSSPTFLNFHTDGPTSFPPSRAGTPGNLNRPTRKGKPGTGSGLRVKTSPMKKKQGSLAGIPRGRGSRNSPVGNGSLPNNQEDNEDFCASCGGGGELLCCDGEGCVRSFHFRCVDPPLSQDALPDSWLCHECNVKQNGKNESLVVPGIVGPLVADLESKNSSAFHLPKSIRNYFEDVQTGPDGEYEGPPQPKSKTSKPEVEPDYFKTRDSNRNIILCRGCNLAASRPDRMIIGCSFCDQYWHLDCIPNAPMAKPPSAGRQWRCPLHIDDLLIELPDQLAPAHRWRKIKGAPAIKPLHARGNKNNGHIEIENDPTDDEAAPDMPFHEQREFGQVLRLPEWGIKADFITKVKASKRQYLPEMVAPPNFKRRKQFNDYSIREQEAALTFKALQLREEFPGNGMNLLHRALIDQMPDNVIDLMSGVSASDIESGRPLSDGDRQRLKAVKSWTEAMLAKDDAVKAKAKATMEANHNGVTEEDPVVASSSDAAIANPAFADSTSTNGTHAEATPAKGAQDELMAESVTAKEVAPEELVEEQL